METQPLLLGVDAGTTTLKASLVDADMRIHCEAEHPVTLCGGSEMDMSLLWRTFCEVLRSLRARGPALWPRVAGVGVAGQGDGLWLLDKKKRPLGNAIVWNDMRAKAVQFENAAEVEKVRLAENVNRLLPGNAPMLLRWLRQYEAARYDAIWQVTSCKDWLNYNLCGVLATDHTSAGSGAVNLATGHISTALLKALGIEDAAGKFPRSRNAGDIIGQVTDEAARQTGLAAGLPVICGLLDGSAVTFGAQVLGPREGCVVAGTTIGNILVTDETGPPTSLSPMVLPHAATGCNVYSHPCLNGAGTSDYIDELLIPGRDHRQEEAYIAHIPPGSEGLLFQPYLRGERAPFTCPPAAAGFFGLAPHHTRAHMVMAVYEGLAFSSLDAYRSMAKPMDRLYLAGGLSNSRFYAQLFSDVMGLPVLRVKTKQLGTLGVAKMIALGLGLKGDYRDFEKPDCEQFLPNAKNHALYEAWFEVFYALRRQMVPLWELREAALEKIRALQ